MSDARSKKFSDALTKAWSHLVLLDLKEPSVEVIPAEVLDLLYLLMPLIHEPTKCNGVTLSFGKPGKSSHFIRRVAKNVFVLHLNMAFPFHLEPIRDEVRSGCVMLQASADVIHPAVANGFLNRRAVAIWLNDILYPVTRDWTLDVEFLRDFSMRFRDFKVICLPVLEFEQSQWPLASSGLTANGCSIKAHPWYAVPQVIRPLDTRTFVVWAPEWEHCILSTHQHSQRLLRLVDRLGQHYKINIKDFDLVIRTVMLQEVHNLPRDLGDSMIIFLEAVASRLQEGTLNRFLVESINVLQFEEDSTLEQNHEYLNMALRDLKKHKIEAQIDNGSDNVDDNYESDTFSNYSDENSNVSWISYVFGVELNHTEYD